jgi:hypothetical protein
MFCPSCGIEDSNQNQFCRGCGTSLQAVRSTLEHSEDITTSEVSAREEIGRAIAAKIAQFEHPNEFRRAVHEILPAIEDFLRSPEERLLLKREERLSQIRDGVLTSVVGLSIILTFFLISWLLGWPKILIVSALGLLVFLIGLGITCTTAWFTALPKTTRSDVKPGRFTRAAHSRNLSAKEMPSEHSTFSSVTEGTTREL